MNREISLLVIRENEVDCQYYNELEKYGYKINYNINNLNRKINVIIVDGSIGFKLKTLPALKYNKIYINIPILTIIDKDETDCITLYYEAGISDYIKKPFCIDEIIIRVEGVIGYKGTMDMLYENLYQIQTYKRIIKDKDKKFQSLIDKMPISVWIKDNRGIYTDINTKYCEFSNTTPSQIIGKSDKEIWEEKIANQFIEEDNSVIKSKKSIIFEEIQLFTNEERVYKVSKTPLFDSEGVVVGMIGTSQDITDFKLREVNMLKNIGTDFMTKIPNRRHLYGYLEDILKNEQVTVIFIDIDEFKKINDIYGHKFGDDVLKIIANRLCEFFKTDFVARIGGDEFIIVTNDDKDDIELLIFLNKLINKISLDICIGGKRCSVTGSMGVVKSSREDTIESILIKVDLAMYKAKNKGKNTFHFYEEGMIEEVEINSNIEVDLRKALEKEEICLYYQPQFSYDRTLVGFESLFRWNNEKYKEIPVSRIINIIEENKLIHPIGDFIFEKACIFAREINEGALDKINVSINISPLQLMRDGFVTEIKRIIKGTKVNPTWIGIEITEGIFLENMEKSIDIIYKLKNLGIAVFLDDFGTGYSSLNYLVKLPISAIKIDKSFIDEIPKKMMYNSLVKLITDLAHSMGVYVVAEGVEEYSQLEMLKLMKVDVIQGYIYSKPLKEEDAKELTQSIKFEVL